MIILSLFILSLIHNHFSQTCNANSDCTTPSSCGLLRNITSPFRLKHDPKNCGHFELECENDVASLTLNSQKYLVKEINYTKETIRVADPSVNNQICSFPSYAAAYYYEHYPYPYSSARPWSLNFITCPNPVKSSSLFTNITYCASDSSTYRYVMVGDMKASQLENMCTLELTAMTSWEFRDYGNVSLSEIHDSLLYGFDVGFCGRCGRLFTAWEKLGSLMIGIVPMIAIIVVILVVGLSFPLIIIAVLVLLSYYVFILFRLKETGISILIFEIAGLIIVAPKLVICPFAVLFLIYKFRRRRLSVYEAIECFLQSDNKLTPIRYSYSDVKKMTRNFQDKLGQGGYGSVYKGKLRSGHEVAVKLLRESGANGQDFINEIGTIGRIHHINVVELVGYCAQGSKRALLFDFMPNGSLEKYLFNRERTTYLCWDTKFDIAIGIARGIAYLHQGCDVQILHFDIKPHNILLDENFTPKISDFGLAKFCATDKSTMTMTAARGTIGYVAPELITRSIGVVSYKADVYSFGMLLIEMVGLKGDSNEKNDVPNKYFPYWIYDCLNQGKDIEIGNVDEKMDNDSTRSLVRKMTIVALWCIQMNPDDRPSMNKVLEMLEVDDERLKIPNYPSHSSYIVAVVDESGTTRSTDSVPLQCYSDA